MESSIESNLHYLAFDELGVTMSVIAVALAFVVLVWNAVKAIHDWRTLAKRPTAEKIRNHEERISTLEGCCTDVQGKLESDWQFQQDETEMNRLMLKSIKQLLSHSLDGNNTQGLKEMEAEIDGYLIKHIQ